PTKNLHCQGVWFSFIPQGALGSRSRDAQRPCWSELFFRNAFIRITRVINTERLHTFIVHIPQIVPHKLLDIDNSFSLTDLPVELHAVQTAHHQVHVMRHSVTISQKQHGRSPIALCFQRNVYGLMALFLPKDFMD
ncbi:MAG: hypothetical protein AAFZ15_34950, partial [Bacteroidota bacterium]